MKNNDIYRLNRRTSAIALAGAAIVAGCVCAGAVMHRPDTADSVFGSTWASTFELFTASANILLFIACFCVIPYGVDGIRKNNYHLPNWCVVLMFAGTVSVTAVLLLSLGIVLPTVGWTAAFAGSRLLWRLICPVLAILLCTTWITDHRITFADSLIGVIHVALCSVSFFASFAFRTDVDEARNALTVFGEALPYWLLPLSVPVAAWIAGLALRALHNASYDHRKEREADYYIAEFRRRDLRSAVAKMAETNRRTNRSADIVVPRRVLALMATYAGTGESTETLCKLYLEAYFDKRNQPRN